MKKRYNKIISLTVLLAIFCCFSIITYGQEGEPFIAAPFDTMAYKVPAGTFSGSGGKGQSTNTHRIMAAPPNDNFASAIALTVGTWTSGTTFNGTIEAGENIDCNLVSATSVWYSFVATNATMYVCVELQGGADWIGGAVWNTVTLPTGSCPAMQCQSSEFGPQSFGMQLTNLGIGQTYYVQITSSSAADNNTLNVIATTAFPPALPYVGAPACTLTNPMPSSASSTCATAYAACYLNQCNPTAAQVAAAGCPTQAVTLNSNAVYTTCYTFSNSNSNAEVGIQAYVTSNCANICNGNANVDWMDWTLYNSTCGLVGCGNLSNVKIDGAGCSKSYTICQTFEVTTAIVGGGCNVLTNCTVTGVEPYAAWFNCVPVVCTVLPIKLSTFSVEYQQVSNTVDIYWSTQTETNNKLFTVEKSADGTNWTTVAKVPTAAENGNSVTQLYYTAVDEDPYPGLSYYRLMQTDKDGQYTYSSTVPLTLPADYSAHIFPNPTTGDLTLQYLTQSPDPVNIKISDISGKALSRYTISEVQQGVNNFNVITSSLAPGMYILQVSNEQKTFFLKFIKE